MQEQNEFDQLVQEMDLSLSVDSTTAATVKEDTSHPRLSLYKNRSRALDQEKRWWQSLRMHRSKANRDAKFDSNRDISSPSSAQASVENKKRSGRKNPWASKSTGYVGSSWRSYSNHLMLAEWLLFFPPSFFESYAFKLCPKGRQVFVRAQKGCTDVFSRTGRLLFHTKSQLPGGGLGQSEHHNSSYCTMLDCILSSSNKPAQDESSEKILDFKVLDLIHFRTTRYTMLPFRERCDWLENYWREQIEANDNQDPVRFEVIRSHSCELESMRSVLSEQPKFSLDGVLFYHMDVMYEPGPTPLVGWLKPYMIPEWFPQIKVHEDYLKDIPMEYTDYLNEIRQQETAKGNPSKCIPPATAVILPQS